MIAAQTCPGTGTIFPRPESDAVAQLGTKRAHDIFLENRRRAERIWLVVGVWTRDNREPPRLFPINVSLLNERSSRRRNECGRRLEKLSFPSLSTHNCGGNSRQSASAPGTIRNIPARRWITIQGIFLAFSLFLLSVFSLFPPSLSLSSGFFLFSLSFLYLPLFSVFSLLSPSSALCLFSLQLFAVSSLVLSFLCHSSSLPSSLYHPPLLSLSLSPFTVATLINSAAFCLRQRLPPHPFAFAISSPAKGRILNNSKRS